MANVQICCVRRTAFVGSLADLSSSDPGVLVDPKVSQINTLA